MSNTEVEGHINVTPEFKLKKTVIKRIKPNMDSQTTCTNSLLPRCLVIASFPGSPLGSDKSWVEAWERGYFNEGNPVRGG